MFERIKVSGDCYRLIPSHFPPIKLFEHLLDPDELDAAYALESLTNDRLQDEAGNIALLEPGERIVGPGSSAIMAAFTHTGTESRFTSGRYGVYYAGLDLDTTIAESCHSRTRFLMATNETAQTLTMRCYHCKIDSELIDLRGNADVHHPTDYAHAQYIAAQLKQQNENGILYQSVRHPGGECIAALRPKALTPPAIQAGHFQFFWDGHAITHIAELKEWKGHV